MIVNEKYAVQDKVKQISDLAERILKRVEYVSEEFTILDSEDGSDREFSYLYSNDDSVLELYNDLYEDGEVVAFKDVVSDILDSRFRVLACVVDYDTNQTGGLDVNSFVIRVYFSLPQFSSKKNNYNLERLKRTLMHEITHLHDMLLKNNNSYYYNGKSQNFKMSDLNDSEKDVIVGLNPHIMDILYRLWNDSEMNAQQITITHELVSAIRDGIQTLRFTDCDCEVFDVIKEVLSRGRYYNSKHDYRRMSCDRFKRWFIENSEKRLKKILDKKQKNDYLLGVG